MWQITKSYDKEVIASALSVDFKEDVELIYKFRMLDDDGDVYFEGLSDDCDSAEAFAPLDDYGQPGFGCTEIQYWSDTRNSWETL